MACFSMSNALGPGGGECMTTTPARVPAPGALPGAASDGRLARRGVVPRHGEPGPAPVWDVAGRLWCWHLALLVYVRR